MARWCVHTGQSPDTYRSLTRRQLQLFWDAQNDHNRQSQ